MLYQSTDNTLNTQQQGQSDKPGDYTRNCKQQYAKLGIATLNVNIMRGCSAEIVEIFSRRNVDIRFVNETRGRNESNQKNGKELSL